jgi:hypothetical protein
VFPTLVEQLARKIEPAGTADFKNSLTLAEASLPSSKTAPPQSVRAIATWDIGDLDCRRFTIFIAGLSNAWSVVENAQPPGGRRGPLIQRKILQLEFKQVGDGIQLVPPPEWVYRAANVQVEDDNDKEKDGQPDPLLDLRYNMLKHIQEQVDKREKPDQWNAKTRQAAQEIQRLADGLAQGERQRKLWHKERDDILLRLRSLQEETIKKKKELDRQLFAGELEDTILQIDLELMKMRLKSVHGQATRSCAACHRAMDFKTWVGQVPLPKAKQAELPAPSPQIREGKIVQLDDKNHLAEVNVGSEQGLQKDQTLDVYRLRPQPVYLGRLRMIEVQANRAVGHIEPQAAWKALQVGDQVAGSLAKRNAPDPRGDSELGLQLDPEPEGGQRSLVALKARLQRLQQLMQGAK